MNALPKSDRKALLRPLANPTSGRGESLEETLRWSHELVREARELLERSQKVTLEQRLTLARSQAIITESYALLRQIRDKAP